MLLPASLSMNHPFCRHCHLQFFLFQDSDVPNCGVRKVPHTILLQPSNRPCTTIKSSQSQQQLHFVCCFNTPTEVLPVHAQKCSPSLSLKPFQAIPCTLVKNDRIGAEAVIYDRQQSFACRKVAPGEILPASAVPPQRSHTLSMCNLGMMRRGKGS